MALAWFICGYRIKANLKDGRLNVRVCAMNDFTPQINADGGAWSESEVLGGYAVVKVRASAATLTTIAGAAGFTRIPNNWVDLSTTLGSLTTNQRTTLLNLIQGMGYTPAEISAALGSNLSGWRTKTLGQVLRFIASRRLKPRWDDVQSQIVLDGILQACRPIDDVDKEVLSDAQLMLKVQISENKSSLDEIKKAGEAVGANAYIIALAQADFLNYQKKHKGE